MHWFKADLHIHSVLSPCGGLEMSPKGVMQEARKKDISIISITDHNSCANSRVYAQAARDYGLNYIFGVEVQTAEEIHIIALFDTEVQALDFGDELYDSLLAVDNDPKFFGDQVVLENDNTIKCFLKKALINSSTWNLETVCKKIEYYGGFYFPAHVDAPQFSLLSQLGFIPTHLKIDAMGITAGCDVEKLYGIYPELRDYSLIRSSDAHYLQDIGTGTTRFFLQEPTLKEIILACRNQEGRSLKN